MVNPVAEERSTSSDHVLAATGDACAHPMAKAIEAVGRRVLHRGEHGQHSVPIAVAALATAYAEDAFTVLPQDLEATIPIGAEPKGWVHLPDAPVKPVANIGPRRHYSNIRPPRLARASLNREFASDEAV